jgi:sugar-specific transcriptional regulator TrmB
MKYYDYFSELGFSQKEAEIYLTLYKLGMQPASTIAKYVQLERTSVYKTLMFFVEKDLVLVSQK